MNDTIEINLRGLTEKNRDTLEKILDEQLNVCPDEINEQALEDVRNFEE